MSLWTVWCLDYHIDIHGSNFYIGHDGKQMASVFLIALSKVIYITTFCRDKRPQFPGPPPAFFLLVSGVHFVNKATLE